MTYPVPRRLSLPVVPYAVSDEYWKFGDRVPRRWAPRARHLGDDVVVPAGTVVSAIGEGEVVLAETLPGSEKHRSWGGLVVVGHTISLGPASISSNSPSGRGRNPVLLSFYSVYGHLRDLAVSKGDAVAGGRKLGEVAEGYTPQNGWWEQAHLHFAIYTGPWRGVVLPGYWRPERFWQTQLRWWREPGGFIDNYNNL